MFEDVTHASVGTGNHSNEHDFDLDDRISSESELDTETRTLLYSLCSESESLADDFPMSYNPMLEDTSHLAMHLHQTPEDDESFLALLRDACPSPVKSVSGSVSYDKWGGLKHLGFLDDGDFWESGLDTTYPMELGGTPDFFQGVNVVEDDPQAPTGTSTGHDPDPHFSNLPSSAATGEDEAVDHSLGDVHPSQPNPTTIQQPLLAIKNTGAPRKRNSKGKLECTARGCTKFVLAAKCKSHMCKGHCLINGGCQDHGGGKGNRPFLENSTSIPMGSESTVTDNNHWALSRPPSALPLQPITSSAMNNSKSNLNKVTNPEKMFRTEMSSAHETAWRQKKQAQLEVLESKSLKAEYERRYQNQVVVIFWDKVGALIKIIGSTYAYHI